MIEVIQLRRYAYSVRWIKSDTHVCGASGWDITWYPSPQGEEACAFCASVFDYEDIPGSRPGWVEDEVLRASRVVFDDPVDTPASKIDLSTPAFDGCPSVSVADAIVFERMWPRLQELVRSVPHLPKIAKPSHERKFAFP